MPVFLRIGAVDLGDEVTDEGLLVEGCEVRAEEVVSRAEKAVMVHLEEDGEKWITWIVRESKQVASCIVLSSS